MASEMLLTEGYSVENNAVLLETLHSVLGEALRTSCCRDKILRCVVSDSQNNESNALALVCYIHIDYR
jgi:hypothetical protein